MNEHIRRARQLLEDSEAILERSAEVLGRLRGRDFDWGDWQHRMPAEGPDLRAWLDELPELLAAPAPRPEDSEKATAARVVVPMSKRAAEGWAFLDGGFREKQIDRRATDRLIHGLASSSTINEHDYALIARGMTAVLPLPVLSVHTGHECPLGQVFYIRANASKVYIRAQIFDTDAGDYAWNLIQCGDLRAFSGAAARDSMKLQGVVEKKKFYSEWRLGEVSICRKGANPDSIFEIWDGTDDGSKFFATATVTPIRRGEAA